MDFKPATSAEILDQLGSRLREQRLLRGLARPDLAAMAGVSRGARRTLAQRSGAGSLEALVRVAQAHPAISAADCVSPRG